MAVYNNGRFSGGDMSAMAKYLNQMNDQLEFVLGNLDSENMTGDYNQQLQYVQDAARSASRQVRGMEESSQSIWEAVAAAQRAEEAVNAMVQQVNTMLQNHQIPAKASATWNGTRFEATYPVEVEAGQLLSLQVDDMGGAGEQVRVYPVGGGAEAVVDSAGQAVGTLSAGWHTLLYRGYGVGMVLLG